MQKLNFKNLAQLKKHPPVKAGEAESYAAVLKYCQSTSGRKSSQRISPLDSRSIFIQRLSPSRCLIDAAFLKYPIDVPQRVQKSLCSSCLSAFRYLINLSMRPYYQIVICFAIPFGVLLFGNSDQEYCL